VYRVKTFGTDMKVFHVHHELERLDREVNEFFAGHPESRLIGVSDSAVTDDKGATIGILRVVAYDE
jgi:hypothetical protein